MINKLFPYIFLLAFSIFTSCNYTFSQQSFIYSYAEGPGFGSGLDAVQTIDGGYLLTGQQPSGTPGISNSKSLILRTDHIGNVLWTSSPGNPLLSDFAEDILMEEDGSFTLCGFSFSEGFESGRFNWLYHMAANGDSLWSSSYYGDGMNSLVKTEDGGYVMGGEAFLDGEQKFYVLKVDAEGDSLWAKTYGGWPNTEACQSIFLSPEGDIFAAGHITNPEISRSDFFVVRLDPNGNEIWANRYESEYGDFAQSIIPTPDGDLIIGGNRSYFPDPIGSDVLVLKIDEDGNEIWTSVIGDELGSECYQICADEDGGFLSVGSNRIEGATGSFVYLLKFDSEGDTLWSRNIRRDEDLWGTGISVEKTSDKGFVIAGSLGPNTSNTYAALIKTDSLGNVSLIRIKGKVFYDEDDDLEYDDGEPGLANEIIQAEPNGYFTLTDSEGNFDLVVYQTDTFKLESSHPEYWMQSFPDTSIYHYVLIDSFDQDLDTLYFAKSLIPGITDVSIDMTGTNAQPGNNVTYWINYKNKGTEAVSSGLITFTFNEDLNFIGSSPEPDMVTDTSLQWIYSDLELFASENILVHTMLDPTASPSDVLEHEVLITPFDTDNDTTDNIFIWIQPIVAAFDPNDKGSVPEADALDRIPIETEVIDYTVRFQNTGTAPATYVLIIDTLDNELDISTLELISSSHPLNLNLESPGILRFIFDPIFLPDSSADEANSHGFVKFRVLLKEGLDIGTEINNDVDIFFDYNPPIKTNTVRLVLSDIMSSVFDSDNRSEGIECYPNPAKNYVYLRTESPTNRMALIEISDMNGIIVKREQHLWQEVINLNIEALHSGSYLIRVIDPLSSRVNSSKLVLISEE